MGRRRAINRTRASDNILQVLPVEVITSLPNTNIADALGRPAERDAGKRDETVKASTCRIAGWSRG